MSDIPPKIKGVFRWVSDIDPITFSDHRHGHWESQSKESYKCFHESIKFGIARNTQVLHNKNSCRMHPFLRVFERQRDPSSGWRLTLMPKLLLVRLAWRAECSNRAFGAGSPRSCTRPNSHRLQAWGSFAQKLMRASEHDHLISTHASNIHSHTQRLQQLNNAVPQENR